MQQLLLDIAPDCPATFAQFIPGDNSEALAAVRALIEQRGNDPLICLWGATASGKTHLLQAAITAAHERAETALYLDASAPIDLAAADCMLLAIDNVEHLNQADQIELFSRINRAREGQGRILCTGNVAPMHLPLRADLTTRLGWHLVFHLHPLSDAHKSTALIQRAQQLGFALTPEIPDYLLRHWRRDLPSLFALLEHLDRTSREQQRPVTLPLLREVLETTLI